MSRTKKAPTYQYGIEITKPFSQKMYDHNNAIALEMKRHIVSEIHKAYSQEMGTEESADKDSGKLHKIASTFTGYQFGDEYDFEGMKDEAINILANIENWSLHQEYGYLCSEGIVPKIKMKMIGFDNAKDGCWDCYWTNGWEEASPHLKLSLKDIIQDIDGAEVRFSHSLDSSIPYIKVYTKSEAEDVVQQLLVHNIDSEVDLYEDDDGEGDDGRPIILQRWSVRLKNYKNKQYE